MMSDFWFPWYPSLYKLDTLHLTAEQDGIYRRLIDHYMETARELPDNVAAIARIAGVDSSSNALSIVLAFFEHVPSMGYRHKKCDATLADMYERSVKRHGIAKTAANKRWKKVKEKQKPECLQHASSMPDAMLNDATPTPTDTLLVNIPKFDSIPAEWKKWALEKTTLSGDRLADTWAEFYEYWSVGKGKKIKRGDWFRSWRKWCDKYLIGGGKPLNNKPVENKSRVITYGGRRD